MGQIASMLSAVKPAKSPLQRELDSLTGVLGWIAWGAVAIIIITGLLRGQEITSVILLGISMAISAIPTGMPSFVQAMLSYGSRQLAEHKAVVKNLTDVETLGATSAINSDKTGTLTMNEMTVESLYYRGEWFTVAGSGYEKSGEVRHVAGLPVPQFNQLALGLTLCSDVTKQAGKMILVDDNFGTLVTAVRLGRSIYEKIVSYVRFQMSQLFSLVLLFLVASIFDINNGVPLTPIMVLFLNFFIAIFPVIVILLDPVPDGIMLKPPRDPKKTIANPAAVTLWFVYGGLIFVTTLVPLLLYPDLLSSTVPNVPVTMAFVVCALGSIFGGLVMRRDPESGLAAPIIDAVKWLSIPLALTVVAVEVPFMQRLVGTVSLSGNEWLTALGLALLVPVLIELEKWLRRARLRRRAAQA